MHLEYALVEINLVFTYCFRITVPFEGCHDFLVFSVIDTS